MLHFLQVDKRRLKMNKKKKFIFSEKELSLREIKKIEFLIDLNLAEKQTDLLGDVYYLIKGIL